MGKLAVLGLILTDHHEAFEWDLLQVGIDLLDFYRGTLSPRRLWLAVRHLPPDGALARSLDPQLADVGAWSQTHELIAYLIDLTYAAHTPEGKTPPRYARPNDVLEARRRRDERNRMLLAQAERNRVRDAAERNAIEGS